MSRTKSKYARKPATEVALGREIAKGGEGRIHELEGKPGLVAKVYHQLPTSEKAAKLEAMVAARTEELIRVAAWPVELLRGSPGGPPIGVVMPRVDDHKDIHLLYGPRSRLAAFPLAGWPFLIRAATNLARAFAVVHAHGHVVGDVNDRVALVSERALVRLIDCDGFQIQHRGKRFPCDVGVLTHQPPELQGVKSFRGLVRSTEHDAFGLAVLVFQLLFMARHPFSGSYGKAGDMPLERAIREHRFVYGAEAEARGMRPPPASLDLSCVTRDVGRLFEQAFSPRAPKERRPSALRWVEALDELGRLVQHCRTNPSHAYLKGRTCPFCAIDRQTDLALFHQPLPSRGSSGRPPTSVHLPTLWKEILAVEAPGKAPELPQELVAFARECGKAVRVRKLRWSATLGAGLSAVGLFAASGGYSLALLLLVPLFWLKRRKPPGGAGLSRRARELVRRWGEKTSARAFQERRAELERAQKELDGLDEEHTRGLAELNVKRRQHQLDAFLRRQRIAEANLPALDRGAKAVLESYGIETADEVSLPSLSKVRALSEPARKALFAWRAQQESRFVFDPAKGVDPNARAAFERATQKRRADLVQKLLDGPARLRSAAQQISVARQTLGAEIQPLLKEIEQARRAA